MRSDDARSSDIPAWANRLAAWVFALGFLWWCVRWADTVDARLSRIEVALFLPITASHSQAQK